MIKNNIQIALAFLLVSVLAVTACNKDDEAPVVEEPNVPASTEGRPNAFLGCLEIDTRDVDMSAWDNATIDGDIISVIANGDRILDTHELDGPSAATNFSYTFENNGYNHVILYAHNEGDIPPNTASVSMNDLNFTLSADLSENGYVDVVVTGFGVTCDS